MEQVGKAMRRAGLVGALLVGALGIFVGVAISTLAGTALVARSTPAPDPVTRYVPCIEAGMTAAQARAAEPRVLPCPPAGTSRSRPVVVEDGISPVRLAYFEDGMWYDASDPRRPILTVWSWRWP